MRVVGLPHSAFDFAAWTHLIPESEIRRLLRFEAKYYFAGGKPGVLPSKALSQVLIDIGSGFLDLLKQGSEHEVIDSFNYCPSEGLTSLRKFLANFLRERDGLDLDPEEGYKQVVITTGSQQALYAIADALLDPGDVIICSRPAYLGFVNIAAKFRANIVTVPIDQGGVAPQHVREAIEHSTKEFGKRPELIYLVPDSDNPSGTTMPWSRRRELFDIAEEEDLLILEDAAYREIQFEGKRMDPIKALDKENHRVAYLRSTSKEAAPLRIGYSVLPPEIRTEVVKGKGYMDLNTAALTQLFVEVYYRKYFRQFIDDIREGYKERCKAMKKGIDERFPGGERTDPKGGFFVWWSAGRPEFDSKAFLEDIALKKDIAYVPGSAFFPQFGNAYLPDKGRIVEMQPETNGMRLSYSYLEPRTLYEGIVRLGDLLSRTL